jgi:hypothetical protein
MAKMRIGGKPHRHQQSPIHGGHVTTADPASHMENT